MAKTGVMWDGPVELMARLLDDSFEVLPWDVSENSRVLEKVSVIAAYGHPTVDGPLMDRTPHLRVISNHGVGVDHINVAAAESRGVPVGNTPGCLDQSTADMTMALLLAAARNVVVGDRYAKGPDFIHYDPSFMIGHEVSGSTLGIVGLGRIGREVAKRAAGFSMKVLYHNRNRASEAERELGVLYRSLDELLAESDFVSLNCPLTPETTGLIGREQFARMKPSAILINMARGPVVVSDDICEALKNNVIAGAALDVTDPEPLPRAHPLLGLENVIIVPHLGSASDRTRQRMLEMTVENLKAGLAGKELPYRVHS